MSLIGTILSFVAQKISSFREQPTQSAVWQLLLSTTINMIKFFTVSLILDILWSGWILWHLKCVDACALLRCLTVVRQWRPIYMAMTKTVLTQPLDFTGRVTKKTRGTHHCYTLSWCPRVACSAVMVAHYLPQRVLHQQSIWWLRCAHPHWLVPEQDSGKELGGSTLSTLGLHTGKG